MPGINITGGGTAAERFKLLLIDKLYGGASTANTAIQQHGHRSQRQLRRLRLTDADGNNIFMCGVDECGGPAGVGG
jgi:hypothetical protein